jgi:hypothetical protein
MAAPIKVTTPLGSFNCIWDAAKKHKLTAQSIRIRMLKDPHNYYKTKV